MQKRWLFLPIESKVRELQGKVLLACVAAKHGFDVVVGSKSEIMPRSAFFPKGIFLNFGLAKNFAKYSIKLKKQGHNVIVIDEEGLVTLNDDLYIRYRVSENALAATDIVFCWGKKQALLIESENKAYGTGSKVIATGNSRFDILRPDYRVIFYDDVSNINKQYGQIILVNTNFGYANHFMGEEFALQSLKQKGWMDSPEDEKYFIRRIEWQKKICRYFIEMLPELARKFPSHSIVIRPHPSEKHELWLNCTSKIKNAYVVHSGNVIPWLMASDLLIHNGCTTAIEAFLVDTPAISYRPLIIEEMESKLPNDISLEVRSLNELLEFSFELLNKNLINENFKKEQLSFHVTALDGDTASERIVDELNSFYNTKFVESLANRTTLMNFLFHWQVMRVKHLLKKVLNPKDESRMYQLYKFPELTKKEVDNIIKKFSNINSSLPKLLLTKIGDTSYYIRKKQ